MAYWMLVVSQSNVCPSRHAIEVPLFSDFDADYEIRSGTEDDWREIELVFVPNDEDEDEDDDEEEDEDEESDPEGDFATIFREPDPTAVRAELDEIIQELDGVEPASGAAWVADYLRSAKTIYRFTPHHEDFELAMEALRAVMWGIQKESAGIAYAEGEGWSNQDGCQVTWEFDREDGLEGAWQVAVLDSAGHWQSFSLELSDRAQCRAFREGRSPEAAPAVTRRDK